MVDKPLKTKPSYAIASVDHALRIAVMLQLEGGLTVSEVADRLGISRSTSHRMLSMLVYRDFAYQDGDRIYHPGPVLELAAYSGSRTSRLRSIALPHLRRLVDILDESVNLSIRTGDTVRFIGSVESHQAFRIGSREGMVFPAHRTTGGLLLLAELSESEIEELYAEERYVERRGERPPLSALRPILTQARRSGFVVNSELSERSVVAVGVPVRDDRGTAVAGLSVSIPALRYDSRRLPRLVSVLESASKALETDLEHDANPDFAQGRSPHVAVRVP